MSDTRHEAVHRMASVAGRLRLRGLRPEGEVHADGDYLAELLAKWRELAAAPSPDAPTQLGSEEPTPNTTAEKLGLASPDDRGGERCSTCKGAGWLNASKLDDGMPAPIPCFDCNADGSKPLNFPAADQSRETSE